MAQQPRQKLPLYALAAAVAAVLASAPMLGNPLSVPDQVLIDDAAFLRQPSGILAVFLPRLAPPLPADAEVSPEYPAPLARLLWWLQFRLFNVHAAGYKVTSILLHALAAALACLALTRWTRNAAVGFAASLLVALHPSTLPAMLLRYQGTVLAAILTWALLLALGREAPRATLAAVLAVAAAFAGPTGLAAGMLALAWGLQTRQSRAKPASVIAGLASLVVVALLIVGAPYLRGRVPQVGSSGELAPAASGLGAVLAGGGVQLLHTLVPVPLILERATASNSPTYLALGLWFLLAAAGLIWLAARKREALVPVVWLLAGALAPALEAMGRRHPVTTSPASTYALVCAAALLLAVLGARPAPEAKKKHASRATTRLRLLLPTAFVLLALVRLCYASAWGDDLKMLQRALALSPNNPQYLCQHGWALLDRGRAQQALQRFIAVLKSNPRYPRAHYGLGAASVALETELPRYDERLLLQGLGALRRAAELDPGYAPPLMLLGRTLAREGRSTAALRAAQQGVARAPDSADAYGALGRVLIWCGQFPEAITTLRHALSLQPDLPVAQMGLVDATDPRAGSAAPYLDDSDLAEPANAGWSPPERLLLQGNAFIRSLQPSEAVMNFEGLLRHPLSPDLRAMTQLNLAYAHEVMGHFDQARELLSTVEGLGCAPEWKQTAAARLARMGAYLREVRA